MISALHEHGWWLASRASGLVALGLITVSVAIGLMMAGRIMRKPGRAKTMVALHEIGHMVPAKLSTASDCGAK